MHNTGRIYQLTHTYSFAEVYKTHLRPPLNKFCQKPRRCLKIEQSRLARARGRKTTAQEPRKKNQANEESAVLAAIAAMPEPYRAMGERLHVIIKASAPALSPKVWYGMPAYAKDGKVVCFFRGADKFKERYMTLGFNDVAKLDEGHLWPVAFALKDLTAAEEARIGALVKKAVS